jgi:hypothetical protein
MKKTLTTLFLLAVATTANAGTKRKPANAPNIPCLNAVSEAFHQKWDPIRDQIRTEANDSNEKQRRDLHNESRRLLLAKAEAIKTCNSNAKNISLKKVLAPFN